jgi:hypothetical protein
MPNATFLPPVVFSVIRAFAQQHTENVSFQLHSARGVIALASTAMLAGSPRADIIPSGMPKVTPSRLKGARF